MPKDCLIIRLPYSGRENRKGLPTDTGSKLLGKWPGERDMEPGVALEFDSRLHRALANRSKAGAPLPPNESAYIPAPRQPLQEDAVEFYYDRLTDYPVVYLFCIDREDAGHGIPEGWLSDALRDKLVTPISPYDVRYIAYVGETNNIQERTARHLYDRMGSGHYGDAATETEEGWETRREDQRVDLVIRKARHDGIKISLYVIWHEHFTKSMTLDVEDRFIDYLNSLPDVYLLNSRGNPQSHYYEWQSKDEIFSTIWQRLSRYNEDLFPPEADVRNSELYKVSPFHSLGREQAAAVSEICDVVRELACVNGHSIDLDDELEGQPTRQTRLILLSGASGTGKSIVLSRLFVQLSQELPSSGVGADDSLAYIRPTSRVCLIVNNDQQLKLYQDLAKKLGLQRTRKVEDQCVYKAVPFINAVTEGKRTRPDVVLIDEAHLLLTRSTQGYSNKYHGNQLYDILLRTNAVVIAVFDQEQVMRQRQRIDPAVIGMLMRSSDPTLASGELSKSSLVELGSTGKAAAGRDTFRCHRVMLREQFRIAASRQVIAWIDRLADTSAVGIDPIPEDDVNRHQGRHGSEDRPYDIRVFTSPNLLFEAIDARATQLRNEAGKEPTDARAASPLCRVVATYDWAYKPAEHRGSVRLYRTRLADGSTRWEMPVDGEPPAGALLGRENVFWHPWNMAKKSGDGLEVWSADPETQDEIGSYFTIQGFDLNYVGVIVGPSVGYEDGHVVFRGGMLKDSGVERRDADVYARQQFKILLRRGIHGLYLFAVDPGLQKALCEAAWTSGRLDIPVE